MEKIESKEKGAIYVADREFSWFYGASSSKRARKFNFVNELFAYTLVKDMKDSLRIRGAERKDTVKRSGTMEDDKRIERLVR